MIADAIVQTPDEYFSDIFFALFVYGLGFKTLNPKPYTLKPKT